MYRLFLTDSKFPAKVTNMYENTGWEKKETDFLIKKNHFAIKIQDQYSAFAFCK